MQTDTPVSEVTGSTSAALTAIAEASTPHKLIKKFKERETFMAKDGTMMERDAFWVIPTTAMTHPNPEEFALGVQYGETKPKGQLFTGKNRKARRAEMYNKSKH